jgi:hypothetical protein
MERGSVHPGADEMVTQECFKIAINSGTPKDGGRIAWHNQRESIISADVDLHERHSLFRKPAGFVIRDIINTSAAY